MDWITDRIAIGNYREAQDTALLQQHGFRSVVSLDGTLNQHQAAELGVTEIVGYCFLDGPGNNGRLFRWAVDDVVRLVASSSPVLVHCRAGRSRSAVLVAAYLMRDLGIDPEAAVAHVATRREIAVAPELLELLEEMDA